MGARGDQFKGHFALDISLPQAQEEEKNSSAGTGETISDYEPNHVFQSWNPKSVEADIASLISIEPIKTDDGFIPDSANLLDPAFIIERSSHTDEDSIGEDIQARFRVEQNTYFIPIRSDSEHMLAVWENSQENSIGTHGDDISVQAITVGVDTDVPAFALGEDMDGQALVEESIHYSFSFEDVNKPHCNFCDPLCKEEFTDKNEPKCHEPLPRMCGSFQEYTHGRMDGTHGRMDGTHGRMDGTSYCDSKKKEDVSAFRNTENVFEKNTASINIEHNGNNSSVGHELSTRFYGYQHMHPRAEAYREQTPDQNKGSFSPPSEYPTQSNVESNFRASVNMNNNGNTASSVSSYQARSGETLFSTNVAREGVIILENEPVRKRAQVDFVLFEGNEVFSIPKEAIVANTWMNYYTQSKENFSRLGVDSKLGLLKDNLEQMAQKPELINNSLEQTFSKPELINTSLKQTAPKPEMINNSLEQTVLKPVLVNTSLNQTAPKLELVNNSLKQRALQWKVLQEHSKGALGHSLGCVPKQCSSMTANPGKLKLQHLATRKRQVNEIRRITGTCNQMSGANKVCEKVNSPKLPTTSHCPKFSPPSPKSRNFSPVSPKCSPKSRTCRPNSPKRRIFCPKSSKFRTLSPKSPKIRICDPKSPKIRPFSPKSSIIRPCSPLLSKIRPCSPLPSKIRPCSPKSPKIRQSSAKSSKIRQPSPKSPKIRICSPKSPMFRTFSHKSPKIRTFSPKSSGSKTISPKTKTRHGSARLQHHQNQRPSPTVKANESGNHQKIRQNKKFDQHDHTGAKYISQPNGISFNVKKAKSQTEVNKAKSQTKVNISPSTKQASGAISSSDKKKKAQRASIKKAQSKTKMVSSAFPMSLHTFYDPCSVSPCYSPETTRQLTIESPKENLMVYTTYVRPNPFQPNNRGLFGLISQKQRLYLDNRERVLGSDQTRQLICETECFVRKDPITKNLILENGTVNNLTPKMARSASALKRKEKSLSGSKSEMSNTSRTSTSGKSKNIKHPWVDLQYVELIGDFVYIGRQKEEHAQRGTDTDRNKNSNAHCSKEEPCCCSYLVDTLVIDDCFIPQANEDGAGPSHGSDFCTSPLSELKHSSCIRDTLDLKEMDFPNSIDWHLDAQGNINNNSIELNSDMEDATLHDIEQIITEHPQMNLTKHKKRRSRPNSPVKRSLKGKCPECEPNAPGDVEDKQFIDFEQQVQPTDIEVSDEVQTGSSLQLRTNLLPLRNKEIKMGHRLWDSCYCESPRPRLHVQYAECGTQLNLDDVCCSEASQTGDVLDRTYTGHILDIDYVTACDCQWKSKTTRKRNFYMQVCPEDICPSLKVQTGSSLLLLEPFVKGPVEDVKSHEKKGHPFKANTCKAPLQAHFLEPDLVETCVVETQVMATDINPCTDVQTGNSLMLTEPFPPIRPTVSEEEYPEEDATWGDLSIQDMISENKSVYAYYKRYEDLTRLENDYEMYARPYKTAPNSQKPASEIKVPVPREPSEIRMGVYFGKDGQYEISAGPSFGRRSPSQRHIQQNDTGNYQENNKRDHEQGEFRGVVKEKESKTVTSYEKEVTSDPQLLRSWNPKYKFHLPEPTVLPEDASMFADEDEVAKFEEEQESHRPYKRRRKPTHGPSIETQTLKSTSPDDEPV